MGGTKWMNAPSMFHQAASLLPVAPITSQMQRGLWFRPVHTGFVSITEILTRLKAAMSIELPSGQRMSRLLRDS